MTEDSSPESLRKLLDSLVDKDDISREGTQKRAAEKLGELGDKRAVEPLIDALNDMGEKFRDAGAARAAAEALGKIGDKRAVEPLIKVMAKDGEEFNLRNAAARALGKIGDKRAVYPLIKHLNEWPEFPHAKIALLYDLGFSEDEIIPYLTDNVWSYW